MTLFAPAKINLGLRITGRYANGYHHLESVFVPVDLFDRLDICRAAAYSVRYKWQFAATALEKRALAAGAAGNPLLWKSAALGEKVKSTPLLWNSIAGAQQTADPELWKSIADHEAAPSPLWKSTALERREPYPLWKNAAIPNADSRSAHSYSPLAITVHKRIPSPAGLGGASADAAALIAHLTGLKGPGEASAQLLAEACRLGADIPYFLQYGIWGKAAELVGIGDALKPVEIPPLTGWLCVPDFGFSTGRMFTEVRSWPLPTVQEPSTPLWKSTANLALRLDEIPYSDEPFTGVRLLQNDFDAAATRVFPEQSRILLRAKIAIAQTVRRFLQREWYIGMTGSGAALFAVCASAVPRGELNAVGRVLQARLPRAWRVFSVASYGNP